ncbi:hypothetical protein NBRC3277_3166 [Acetobacter pasteurianus NBRC 3277]|uniref:ORF n=3 Tax=Acetobacteraceae TaxID=433 RepID=Q44284_ACEPA|nr:ORF [Acetobacter pasteurianus]GCD60591.1 hypothetical protein NBRC3277_3166 [Acetobacter pasteurianus NBRC 3277]
MIAVAVAPFGLGHDPPAARPAVLCDPVKGGETARSSACRGGFVTNLSGQRGNPVIQAGVACKPEQEVNVVVFAPCHQTVPGETAVPTHQDTHPGPTAPDLLHDPADVCQCFLPRVPVCRAQGSAEEMVPAEDIQGKIAVMAVISMKGAAFLMAMDTVIGGIHIQNDPGGCVLMLVKEERDEQGSQGLMISNDPTVTICLVPTALQPVQCRFASQCCAVCPAS